MVMVSSIVAAKLKAARDLITAERQRQIDGEGYSAEHDDAHEDGSILRAAILYYQHATNPPLTMRPDGAPMGWPWEAQWWKPKDQMRDLERAGALAMAERDRLRRAHSNVEPAQQKLRMIIEALAKMPFPALSNALL